MATVQSSGHHHCASTSALYYTAMKLVRQRGNSTISMFFHAFKENIRSSLPVTLLLLVIGYALVVDFNLLAGRLGNSPVFHGLCIMVLVLYAAIAGLIFPVLAKFRCTLRQLIRNVLLLLLQHPLTVVAVTAMHFIPFWLIYAHLEWVESLEGIFLLFGPGWHCLCQRTDVGSCVSQLYSGGTARGIKLRKEVHAMKI